MEGHDLFILVAVNTVIELDSHPQLLEIRPCLQENEVGYLKSNTYEGSAPAAWVLVQDNEYPSLALRNRQRRWSRKSHRR